MAQSRTTSESHVYKNANRAFKTSLALYGARLHYVGGKASRRAQIATVRKDSRAVKRTGTKAVKGISNMSTGAKVATGTVVVGAGAYGAHKSYKKRKANKKAQGGHVNHGKKG